MTHSISAYYLSELDDWSRAVSFYEEEIEALELKLEEIIHRNTIPNLAANTEVFLKNFQQQMVQFELLESEIREQENLLIHDDEPDEDQAILPATKMQQTTLREQMKAAEKTFIETKYGCYEFLSETLHP
jgi:hypothetical protein